MITQIKNFIAAFYSHMMLSVTSVKFYKDVYKNYKGYGIKYMFFICAFVSSINIYLVLYAMNHTEKALKQDIKSNIVAYIISQLPNMKYDGSSISLSDSDYISPVFITDSRNNKILAIDLNNDLKSKQNLYAILRNKDIFFPLIKVANYKSLLKGNAASDKAPLQINYQSVLGNKEIYLTKETIKNTIISLLSTTQKMFVVLIPILFVINFCIVLLSKALQILITYFLVNTFVMQTTFKTMFRCLMFNLGPIVIIESVLSLFVYIPYIDFAIQIWLVFLLAQALFEIKKQKSEIDYI